LYGFQLGKDSIGGILISAILPRQVVQSCGKALLQAMLLDTLPANNVHTRAKCMTIELLESAFGDTASSTNCMNDQSSSYP
jgi:hypothetical protein